MKKSEVRRVFFKREFYFLELNNITVTIRSRLFTGQKMVETIKPCAIYNVIREPFWINFKQLNAIKHQNTVPWQFKIIKNYNSRNFVDSWPSSEHWVTIPISNDLEISYLIRWVIIRGGTGPGRPARPFWRPGFLSPGILSPGILSPGLARRFWARGFWARGFWARSPDRAQIPARIIIYVINMWYK